MHDETEFLSPSRRTRLDPRTDCLCLFYGIFCYLARTRDWSTTLWPHHHPQQSTTAFYGISPGGSFRQEYRTDVCHFLRRFPRSIIESKGLPEELAGDYSGGDANEDVDIAARNIGYPLGRGAICSLDFIGSLGFFRGNIDYILYNGVRCSRFV